jgi:beta-lactam-binding protein with PASTA domain
MRKIVVGALICATLGLTAFAVVPAMADHSTALSSSRATVPRLHCRRLDVAEDVVRSRGLRPVERGGGTFGIVVKSNWRVVRTRPTAGTRVARGSRVYLYVSRSC